MFPFSSHQRKDLNSPKTRTNPLVIMLVVVISVYGLYWFNNSNKTKKIQTQMQAIKKAPAGLLFAKLVEDKDSPYKSKIKFSKSYTKIEYWKDGQIIANRTSDILSLPLPDTAYIRIWNGLVDSASFKVILNTTNDSFNQDTITGVVVRDGGKWSPLKFHK